MGLAGEEQWQEGFSTPDGRNSMCDLETGVEVGREKEGHIQGTARSLSPRGEGRVGEVKPERTGARALGLQNKGVGFYPEADGHG